MKTLLVVFVSTTLVVSATISVTVAQTIEQEGGGNAATLLQSEEEIWEYLEQLCVEAPTQRCESMQFILVRDGVTIPMESYNEEEAYHGKEELIEAALAIRAEKELDEDG
jgi:hypothetical protein